MLVVGWLTRTSATKLIHRAKLAGCVLMIRVLPWLLWLLCVVSLPLAADNIRLMTKSWPGFTNEDGTGGYFELVQLVLEPKAGELQLEFSNFNRAVVLVEKQQADMVLAVTKEDGHKLLLSAEPIDFDIIMAVYGRDLQPRAPLTVQLLAQLRLAWDLAYNYGAVLGLSAEGYEVLSVQQGLEMLAKGRIDVYLAEHADLLESGQSLLKNHNLIQQEILQVPVYVGFSHSVRGAMLKKRWDKGMAALQKSGALNKFYQRYPGMRRRAG